MPVPEQVAHFSQLRFAVDEQIEPAGTGSLMVDLIPFPSAVLVRSFRHTVITGKIQIDELLGC